MRSANHDPVQAELLRLVGNGVYLSAIAGLPPTPPAVLAEIFDRLLAEGQRRLSRDAAAGAVGVD